MFDDLLEEHKKKKKMRKLEKLKSDADVYLNQTSHAHSPPLRYVVSSQSHLTYYMYVKVIVLKANSMALPFAFHRLGVPEQALGRIPLGFGIIVEDKLLHLHNVHCVYFFPSHFQSGYFTLY